MEQPNQPNHSPKQSPDSELSQLREAIAALETRVSALEQGGAVPRTVPPPLPTPAPHEKIESRLGLTLVNRIGAVTLAIGIIFFFKYAVDNQWIGALGRVVLGLLAGLLLTAAGEWLHKREQRIFAQGVAGCGVATLYISLYAAFAYYQLIPQAAAFVALLAACAFAVALSFRYGSLGLAAFGLIGGFLAPILLQNPASSPWLDAACLLLLDIASVVIAIRQNWPPLIPVNATWTVLGAVFLLEPAHPGAFVLFTLLIAALHFGAAPSGRATSPLQLPLYAVAHACFTIAGLRAIVLWATAHTAPPNQASLASELGSVFLALYAIAMMTSAVLRRSSMDRVIGLILIALVIAKLYLYDIWLLTRFYRITAFVALGVLLLAASFVYSRFKLRAGIKPE